MDKINARARKLPIPDYNLMAGFHRPSMTGFEVTTEIFTINLAFFSEDRV